MPKTLPNVVMHPAMRAVDGLSVRLPVALLAALLSWAVACQAHADEVAGPAVIADDSVPHRSDDGIADRLMHAFNLLGTRYQRRGTSPDTGFDCSGFIGWVFRVADGVALPRTAHAMFVQQASAAAEVARDALAPGDLVFFRIGRLGQHIDHVGLYAGEGRFIHAPARGGAVRIDTLDQPYWRKHYAGARRVQVAAVPAGDARHQESLSRAAHAAVPYPATGPAPAGSTDIAHTGDATP